MLFKERNKLLIGVQHKMNNLKSYLFFIFITFSTVTFAFDLKLDLGQTNIHSNFFEVPKGATRINFPDGKEQTTFRLYGTWNINDQDKIRVLLAPFTTKATVRSSTPVSFMNQTFAAGTPIDVSYTFNSYRVSYIRTWNQNTDFRPHFGFTGKIRDAAIKLSNGTVSQKRDNVGFVPLLNAGFDYHLNSEWIFLFDVDAAAATQGRAIDGAIEFDYIGFQNYRVGLGYRVLDGGVNTDSNLNFSQLRTAYLSVAREF